MIQYVINGRAYVLQGFGRLPQLYAYLTRDRIRVGAIRGEDPRL